MLPAMAQDGDDAAADDFDREPTDCITASRIDHTAIIDERTIVFYMRGGDIYRNRLSYNCPQLLRDKTFSYDLATSQLCDVDVVTVIEHLGSTLREGVSCGLGPFYPITQEEAEFLRLTPDEQLNAAEADQAVDGDTSEAGGEAAAEAAPAESPASYDPSQYSTVDSDYREDE
jgi:hypothetical protein